MARTPSNYKKYKSESNGRTIAFVVAVVTVLLFGTVLLVNSNKNLTAEQEKNTLQESVSQATSSAFKKALAAMPSLPKLEEKMNILVMGVDWNGDDADRYVGTRSDTMMVVSLDPDKEKVSIVSIPRDSLVMIPRGHGASKINSAHAFGGPKLAVRTVKENFHIPIDRYAVVDTQGLTDLFALLGPFKVVVEKEMHYHDQTAHLNIDLMPGEQVLEPEQLVGYLRFRHDAKADIGRMERQQWFMRQALQRVKHPSIILKAPKLIQIGYENINTDLTVDEIASIFSFGKDLTTKDLVTATLPGHSEDIDGINYLVLSERGANSIFKKLGIKRTSSYKLARMNRLHKDVKRKRIRISIKCSKPMREYAEFLSSVLKEKGWRVKYRLKCELEDCQHAQLNLNHTRVSNEALALLKNDLPLVEDWPVVIKYGAILGSDIILVLPNSGGISRWYTAKNQEHVTGDIPESTEILTASTGQNL